MIVLLNDTDYPEIDGPVRKMLKKIRISFAI